MSSIIGNNWESRPRSMKWRKGGLVLFAAFAWATNNALHYTTSSTVVCHCVSRRASSNTREVTVARVTPVAF